MEVKNQINFLNNNAQTSLAFLIQVGEAPYNLS